MEVKKNILVYFPAKNFLNRAYVIVLLRNIVFIFLILMNQCVIQAKNMEKDIVTAIKLITDSSAGPNGRPIISF